MRLHLEEIPDEGWVVDFDLTDAWARSAALEALDAAPIELGGTLAVRRFADDLVVSGTIRLVVPQGCHRCGEDVCLTVEGQVALSFTPTRSPESTPAARQLAPGDMDVGFYDGERLDLAHVVSEQLILLLPSKLACDQPGVEPIDGCGESRLKPQENPPQVDPRFAVLADLKIEG
jgi:uncharacterized metal-binding protein YceD (DUF177 family)